MKKLVSFFGVLAFASTLMADLTVDNKVADFTALASLYAKQYAPANWKIQALGVNIFNISPWLAKVRATKNDVEYLEVCAQYVSSFQDGHTQFYGPGNFIADMGIIVDQWDGKVLIEAIDRVSLPASRYPFAVGDELISVDGKPVAAQIAEFVKLHTYANPRYTQRLATDQLTFRWQPEIAAAGLLPDEATIEVLLASGKTETYKIKWQKDGTPITKFAPTPNFFGREPSRGRETDLPFNDGSADVPLWQQYIDSKVVRARTEKRDALRKGLWIDEQSGELHPRREYTGYGSNRPVWAFPAGYTARLGRNSSDFISTGTYMSDGQRIGYLRIGQFGTLSNSQLNQLDAEINYFNTNTDGLVVDIMRNPGGYGCNMVEITRRLMTGIFTHFSLQLRPLYADIAAYDDYISTLESLGAPDSLINLYRTERQVIFDTWSANRAMTGAVPACYFDLKVSPTNNSYKKPMILLVDDFSTSAADIMSAMIQDNGRAKLVGYRTSGAGGSVIDIAGGPLAESATTMTNSLIIRARDYEYPGFPKSPYIENVGVRPDVDLDYQTKDNLLNRGKTFVDAFTKIMVDTIKSGGK